MPAQPMTTTSAPSSSHECAADRFHAGEGAFARRALGDAHLERTLAGEAIGESHLPQIAAVAGDRPRCDRNDAEALAARERGEHAAFVDAEHRPPRRLAAHVKAGIAEAGDDEGVGGVVLLDEASRSGSVTCSTSFCVSMPNGPSASVLQRIDGPS